MENSKGITAFKGFDENLRCSGHQYEVGKTYTHDGDVKVCHSGYHSCLNPADVWRYYDISTSRFAEVTASGKVSQDNSVDSKIASSIITIEKELTLSDFIRRVVDWTIANTDKPGDFKANASSHSYATNVSLDGRTINVSSGKCSENVSSDRFGASVMLNCPVMNVSLGDGSKNVSSSSHSVNVSLGVHAESVSANSCTKNASSGPWAKNASSGDYSMNMSSGNHTTNASSGVHTANISSGDYASNVSSGSHSANISSGNYATNASSGNQSEIDCKGKHNVACALGRDSRVRGVDGTWLSVAEYDDNARCVGFTTGCIGKNGLKPNTWYEAKNGKLTAVKTEE